MVSFTIAALGFHVGGKFLDYRASFRERPCVTKFSSIPRINVTAHVLQKVGADFVSMPVVQEYLLSSGI
jgi:hypothetical protein